MINLASRIMRGLVMLASVAMILGAGNVQAAATTLTPTADAYVQNGTNASKNFGTATILNIQTSATAASNYDSYLKFDTTSVSGSITNVKLRLYGKLSAKGSVATTAYSVSDTSWGETSIIWNNKPVLGTALGSVTVGSTAYAWIEIDVTSYVQSEFNAGRKVVSFAYHDSASTTPYITAYSNNNTSANKPQLVITTNAAPTVSLTSPVTNSTYNAPASISFTATAADSDGTVAKVDYYNGTTLVATSTTASTYAATWSNIAAGAYTLTAKATDNLGAVTTSSPVNITVQTPNAAPTVSIASPANNASYIAPASISLTSNAADSDGTVAKVDYYNGTALIGSATAAPYAVTWSNVAVGTYSITARATDNLGAVTTSAGVNVTVKANQAPTVSITAPVTNSVVAAPANVSLTASAADSDGTVAKVDYYNGTTLIGTATTSPYAATWSNVAAGTYTLTAKATDNLGAVTTSTAITLVVNALPTVALTSPANNATYIAPASVSLTATAADSDGTIAKVEYYNGTTLIGTATTSPYTATWSSVAAGTYTLTAKATDNRGGVTTSAANTIKVNAAPTVAITSPVNNASYLSPANISLTASAADSDGSVSKVEYYNGSTLIASATVSPYNGSWNNIPSGTYNLTAKATDNLGAVTTSAVITITVNNAPTVSITAPANGASYTAPASFTLSATAADSDGTIQKVDFYQNGILLGSVAASPYTYSISNLATGSYSYTAKATDNNNAVTASAAVSVNVNVSGSLVAPFNYVYDEVGKLTGMYDNNGNSASYVYDTVGNILSVSRKSTGAVTILEFTPDSGLVGDTVTITGTGFSTTASQNTVKFNGVQATVTSATASTLVVAVPTGATSGTISVSNAAGSATSSSNFIVSVAGSSTSAPTISSFTPTIANAGATVAITGTGFQTNLVNDKVSINGLAVKITAATSTTLNTVIPTGVGSGRIKVTTPYGSATSAASIIIPPSTILSTDVIASTQLTVDGTAQSLAITTANKVGVALVDGTQNDYLTIDVSNFVVNPAGGSVAYEVYKPDNSLLVSGSIADTTTSIHLPLLPKTGTYAVYFKPGASTVTLSVAVSHDKVIVTDGIAVAESINQTGGTTRLFFNATAGQNLGLGITGLTLTQASSGLAYVYFYKPDGTYLTYTSCYTSSTASGGCGTNLSNVPVTGTYSIVVTPYNGGTGSFTATLSTDMTGTLTAGSTFNLNLARAGQNGRLSFSGTTGDSVGINIAALVTSPANQAAVVTVVNPDGTSLSSVTTATSGGFVNLASLPMTGTYTVFIDPNYAVSASMQITVDPGVALVTNGASSTVTLNTSGQSGRLTFTATAGQNLGLGITGLTLTPTSSSVVYIYVYKPDGTSLLMTSCGTTSTTNGGCSINLSNVPVTGTYSIVVTPYAGGTGSFTATLSTDVTATLTTGTAYNLSLARAGQYGRLTFSGTTGDGLTLALNSVLTAPTTAGNGSVQILNSNGGLLGTTYFSSGNNTLLDLPVLTSTDTYTMLFDMPNAATGSMSIMLSKIIQASIVVDAVPMSVSLVTGQHGRYTFTLASTQSLGLGVSAVSTIPTSGSVSVSVQTPSGAFITCGSYTSGGSCNLPGLVAGTYTVFVDPGSNSASLTLTLSSDVKGTLVANGVAQTFSTTRVGQNGAYTITATAGQQLALSWSGLTIATGTVSVIAPDGTLLFSNTSLTSQSELEWKAVAGVYQVLIDPTGVSTGNVTLQLATDLTGALNVDGTPSTISLLPGQNARYSFTGTAGQKLGLGLSGFTSSPTGTSANVSVLDPTGTVIVSGVLNGAGLSMNVPSLLVAGTYTVVIDPVGSPSTSFTATLSNDIAAVLTANGSAVTFSSARIGQNGRYTFTGTAGQGMSLLLSNSTLGTSTLTVIDPTGAVMTFTSLTATSPIVLDLGALPVTGTYTAFVDPDGILTGAVTMALVADKTGTLVVNSTTATSISTTSGQNARYTFAGNAGTNYSLLLTGISTSPANAGVTFSVLDPMGNEVTVCGTLTVDTVCDIPTLNSTGTYTVLADPSGTATASFSVTVKSEVTGVVIVDGGTATATSFTAGQNVRLSFDNATVGATVRLTVSGLALSPSGSQANLVVLDPNGQNIFGSTYWVFTTSGYSIDLPALNSTGTYTIQFDPVAFAAGSASFAVTTSTPNAISIDGAPVTVSLVANQQPALNFATTVANQAITLSFSSMSTSPTGGVLNYSMSNASSWTSNITAPGVNIPQLPLSAVDNYTMTLIPQTSFSGSVTVALVSDLSGSLTIGGAAGTHTPTVGSQSKRFTFANTTANRSTKIKINSSQWTSGTWWLISPTGATTLATFATTTTALTYTVTLASTGTYTLIMVPAGAGTTNVGKTASVSVL